MLATAYRLVHLLGMAYVVGGATLLAMAARGLDGRQMLAASFRFERIFWPVIGTQVLTGIGNAGLFGPGLPGPGTPWGSALTLKLWVVLVVLGLSVVRTLLVAQLHGAKGQMAPAGVRVVAGTYAATAVGFGAVVVLAVRMAHG